ncbi:expressed protein [Phakopsora pachyrhizi]|uniref:Expressed protein n=1 Tax=Phakopsora pachyrhizi TaxID=170000 RepID=A0AAV0AW16_PHAPC|nr:expressed protein [Phakopsora pachyrhizi]
MELTGLRDNMDEPGHNRDQKSVRSYSEDQFCKVEVENGQIEEGPDADGHIPHTNDSASSISSSTTRNRKNLRKGDGDGEVEQRLQSTSKLSSSIPRSSTEEQEGDNDDSQQVQDQGFSSSFFIDLYPQHLNASCYDQPQPSYPNKAFQPEEYLYEPADSQIVGLDDNEPLLHPLTVRRCFNCGDPGHSLTGCPEPRNESLIRLTKQIFQANKNDGALNQSDSQQRPTQLLSLSTEATEETLKRRRFLASSFYPGIVSQALREAIFWDSSSSRADPDCLDPERPMPWFQSMEKWGYPPGYAIGSGGNGLDPFEAIKKRIEGSQIDDEWESTEILKMHKGRRSSSLLTTQEEGDSDETDSDEEVLRILLPNQKFRQIPIAPLPPPQEEVSKSTQSPKFPENDLLPPLPPSPIGQARKRQCLRRIISYKAGNFDGERLPIYNGKPINNLDYLYSYHNNYNYSNYYQSYYSYYYQTYYPTESQQQQQQAHNFYGTQGHDPSSSSDLKKLSKSINIKKRKKIKTKRKPINGSKSFKGYVDPDNPNNSVEGRGGSGLNYDDDGNCLDDGEEESHSETDESLNETVHRSGKKSKYVSTYLQNALGTFSPPSFFYRSKEYLLHFPEGFSFILN